VVFFIGALSRWRLRLAFIQLLFLDPSRRVGISLLREAARLTDEIGFHSAVIPHWSDFKVAQSSDALRRLLLVRFLFLIFMSLGLVINSVILLFPSWLSLGRCFEGALLFWKALSVLLSLGGLQRGER